MNRQSYPDGISPRYRAGRIVGFDVSVKFGTSGSAREKGARQWFSKHATVDEMCAWQDQARGTLTYGQMTVGTLAADVAKFLSEIPAGRTRYKQRMAQQLAWWCAQPATALTDPQGITTDPRVLTVERWMHERESHQAGDYGPRLGDRSRAAVARDLPRLRAILAAAFPPSDTDPFRGAATSNLYRTALGRFFTVVDRDDPSALNPVRRIETRPTQRYRTQGIDLRIVRRILACAVSKFGRSGDVTVKRLHVLAFVPITPIQLQRLKVAQDFLDVPGATRDEQIAGAVRLLVPPRLKGQRRVLPPPELEPLTPYGVAALRAYAAEPKCHGPFSVPSLRKAFLHACQRAQAQLAAEGITVDLSGVTLYHLKHSLAQTMAVASGLVDERGQVVLHDGVRQAFGHDSAGTTWVYARGAVDPLKLAASQRTALYLDQLFATPLQPERKPAALHRIK